MKSFILESKNMERDSVIWNMIGSLLMAFQSVVFLVILTRNVSLYYSGVFTIAFANANLFLNIGKYGMRNYHVSDVNITYSFIDYRNSRIVTSILMILFSIVYTSYSAYMNNYSFEKSMIIMWMCLFKVPDSIEDVYYGEYQRQGRLDIGAKCFAIRMFFTIVFFAITIILSKNLLLTIILSTVFTFVLTIHLIIRSQSGFCNANVITKKPLSLLKTCFPLFLSSFLSFYIGNAPKYAIDAQLSEEQQACYGFIAMPVFVIGLLNNFVFTPLLFRLSCLWNDGKLKEFLRLIFRQIFIVFSISVVCLIGAYILGIPTLSLLYNTDLSDYKSELLILLLGGGFLGLSGVFNTVITIIRFQKSLLVGYAIVAILALFLSNPIVKQYGMLGASILYLSLMIFLCVCFIVILFIGIRKEHKR